MKDTIELNNLVRKVDVLQFKLDSLNQVNYINQLEYELTKKQDLISQINTFYDSAWLKLLVVITIIGIIIPLIIQYFQRKNITDLLQSTISQLQNNFEKKIEKIKDDNESLVNSSIYEIDRKFTAIEEKTEQIIFEIEGILFFLQASDAFDLEDYEEAAVDYFKSSYYLLNTDKTKRLAIAFSNIKIALDNLGMDKKLDVEKIDLMLFERLEMDLNTTLDYFHGHKYFSIYKQDFLSVLKIVDSHKNVD